MELTDISDICELDALVVAVGHKEYVSMGQKEIEKMFNKKNKTKVLIDIKGILDKKEFEKENYIYWSL